MASQGNFQVKLITSLDKMFLLLVQSSAVLVFHMRYGIVATIFNNAV